MKKTRIPKVLKMYMSFNFDPNVTLLDYLRYLQSILTVHTGTT